MTGPGKVCKYVAAERPLRGGGALDGDVERWWPSGGVAMCAMEDEAGFASQIAHAMAGRASCVSPKRFQRDTLAFDYSVLLRNLGTQ